MEENSTLGKRLKLERLKYKNEKGLYLSRLAKELGSTSQALKYLEEREKDPLIFRYLALLRKNGIDLNKIFENSD